MHRTARRFTGGLLVLALLGIAGCGSEDDGGGGAADEGGSSQGKKAELKIGQVASLTGTFAAIGEASVGGVKVAIDEINAAGGIRVGDTTYRLTVVTRDDESDPARSGVVTQELVRDEGVKFLIGPDASPVLNTGIVIASEAKVIQFSIALAMYQGLQDKGLVAPYTYGFGVSGGLADTSARAVTGMKELWPDAKTAAILMPSDASYDPQVATQTAAIEKNGLEVVGTQRFDAATQDFASFLTKVKGQSPDILVLGTSPVHAQAIVSQAEELGGVSKYAFAFGGAGATALTANNGKPASFPVGWFQHGGHDPYAKVPAMNDFLAKYEDVNGKPPPASQLGQSAFYYTPLKVLATALEKAGTLTDPDAIMEEMIQVRLDGPGGAYRFNDRHQAAIPLGVCATKAHATGPADITCTSVPYAGD